MRKNYFLMLLLISVVILLPLTGRSQVMEVRLPVKSDVSIPLREMKPDKKPVFERIFGENEERKVPNRFRSIPANYSAAADPALQTVYPGPTDQPMVNPIMNFNGIANNANSGRVTPPDPTGDVGPNHYVQVVNCMLQMYNKTGTSVFGPVMTSTIWNGFNGNWTGHNDGDAVILYDEAADRWLISQFAIDCSGSPYTEYELVAISTTSDPTGSYYRYAFLVDYMPDYPKLGVWQDGYYMAINRFNTNTGSTPFIGAAGCVLQRSKMLTGDATALMIYFKTELLGGSGSGAGADCYSMLPSDCDGTAAPAGTPNYFTYINDNTSGGASELRIWALHVDWTTTSNSTFTYVTNLPVTAYTMLGTATGVIPQQGTTNKLDGLGDRLMFRNQYRNFGTYASFVTCHNVNVGSGVAGLRWYEYRKTGASWTVNQQSTYNPGDGKSRWLGSVAMNANGDMGLAYTVSSGSMYPSIYFTGRKSTDALNQMTVTEGIIQTGTASMTGATRWGDYAAMSVDPSDNATFWTTNEYIGTYGGTWPWATKIASFKFTNQPTAITMAASAITLSTATLNGTVNPNGFATTYYFQWGTTTSYGNNTTSTAAGSGTTTLPETAAISGLTGGTTYHFRIVAVNTDGTSYGADMTFVPGQAVVTTTSATAIGLTTATSGGNVTTDGGATVTARGVCWSTSANPVATGSHTTDGSGTGTFTSSITGLTTNTLYHIRAYATNSTGTYYGNDLTFNTLCNIYTLPFSESFAGTTIPSCWSQVDNALNGQVWLFGVITGQTPNPVLTGNYAFVNSDAYGAGNTQNADLVSPTLDMTGLSNITLSFSHYFLSYAGSSGTVSYSINNGSTWTQLQQFTTTSATNPASFSQVVAALAGQSQVRIKWNYTGTFGYSWAIDNVQLTGTGLATLSVTPPSQSVSSTGGQTTFTVTSNSAWTAVSNQTWCTVTPSGTGNGTITSTYSDNLTTTPRTATITVTVIGLTPVTVTVVQDGMAPFLTVTPSNQNVPATPAGTTTFNISANVAWTATSSDTWCTVTPSGTGNGTLIASYTVNTSTASRIATVYVTGSGLSVQNVTVTQNGTSPTLSVSPPNQNVSAAAGSTNFTVTSNSNWTSTSDATWCLVTTAGSGNGTLAANYQENTTTAQRIANITVTVAGLPNQTVTVTQGGAAPVLSVMPADQLVTSAAGSATFTVTTNAQWNATSNVPWCAVTPSGTGSGNLIANYTENTGGADRIASLTVTVSGLTPQVVTVHQLTEVGISSLAGNNIEIVPNPTTGKFHLVTSKEMKEAEVTILDMTGRTILSRLCSEDADLIFDLTGSPQGCYLVKILLNNGITIHRLIVSK